MRKDALNPHKDVTTDYPGTSQLMSVPAPGNIISHENYTTHYNKWGEGNRVILAIHKVTSGGEAWKSILKSLEQEFTIIAPDLLGHGYSQKSQDTYSLDLFCRQLVFLIEELDISKVTILGHSLGARVALAMSYFVPEFVEAIVCVEPPLSGPGKAKYPYDLSSVIEWRKNVVSQGVQFCMASKAGYTYEQAELRARYGVLYDEKAARDIWNGFEHQSMDDFLGSLNCPVALIYGDNGVLQPDQVNQAFQVCDTLKSYRITNCGHNPPWENYEKFMEHLHAFLQSECLVS